MSAYPDITREDRYELRRITDVALADDQLRHAREAMRLALLLLRRSHRHEPADAVRRAIAQAADAQERLA